MSEPAARSENSARIDLGEGAWLEWWPRFLAPEDRPGVEALASELPLRPDTFTLFGKTVPVPRLLSWHGDPGCSYRYSGQTYPPTPWTPTLLRLRAALFEETGLDFNGVLANYYRDGADSMGWHSDDERELGPSPDDIAIASISLGAERRFRMRHRQDGRGRDGPLPDGSLLLMRGTTQRHWKHSLPKTRRPIGPRLNLTFRMLCR
ncbi:MAG: alpha-ketoglutarate-dependent dioxygenase AlkB [Myxococcota bacterium]